MSCMFGKYIDSLLDGNLKSSKIDELLEHSKGCMECSNKLKEIEELDDLVKKTLENSVYEDLKDKIMNKVKSRKSTQPLNTPFKNKRRIIYAATAVLILVISISLLATHIPGVKSNNSDANTSTSVTANEGKLSITAGDIYFSAPGSICALDGDYLVTEDPDGFNVIDLASKKTIKTIPLPGGYSYGFDISDGKIVWSDDSNEKDKSKVKDYLETANMDIFMYDIKTDETKQITTDPSSQIHPRIWRNYIVWEDNRNDTKIDINPEWDIYLYDINTGKEKLITTAPGIHTNPSIKDNKIVWEDGRNFMGNIILRWGGNIPENNTDIYMYDIPTGRETPIATGPLQECNPDVSGNYIVWEDRNNNSFFADIMAYDLVSKKVINITKDEYNQTNPRIYGNYIVWMDERNGTSTNDLIINGQKPNSDIYMYDLSTGNEYLLTGEGPQIMPVISSKWVACVLSRQINSEIQVFKYRQ